MKDCSNIGRVGEPAICPRNGTKQDGLGGCENGER